jgi:methionyl-tRNA formyltransferase
MGSRIKNAEPSLLLMGSKPGSVVALEVALRRGWRVAGVVVSKTDPHPWLPGERLDQAASRMNVPVFHQDNIPDRLTADLVVSYMFRHRVRPETLARADVAALNFHAAPLPEYGGWAFYSVAIIEDALEYGCTCHHMDNGFDTGDLCVVRRFPIEASNETAVSLERRAQNEMIALFVGILDRIERGQPLPREPQDPGRMRYMDQPTFQALKKIPLGADRDTIDRIARAFFYPPYEGAYMELHGDRIEVMPNLARRQIAHDLHEQDYADLAASAIAQELKL